MKTRFHYDLESSTSRPLPVPGRIRNPIILVLYWASKTDARLVALCSSWARATQAALGFFVYFTAFLAFGAAAFALSSLHISPSIVVPVAFIWSVFVGFLDREIVGGLEKSTAFVRPLLALVLGICVAVPMELWLFRGRIAEELQQQYLVQNKAQLEELRAAESQFQQHRKDLQTTLTDLRRQDSEWAKTMDDEIVGRVKVGRTGISGLGPAFVNAQRQQAAVRQEANQVREEIQALEASLPKERQRIDSQFQREEITTITDFVTMYEALDRVVHSSPALLRMSWAITIFWILLEMTPALLKILTPHVDYHHLVKAEIRENVARIDEIAERNYLLAIENPESPELSVSEKFMILRNSPVRVSIRQARKEKNYEARPETPNTAADSARNGNEFVRRFS